MPIYEYYCETCSKELSIWFGSIAKAAAQAAICPDCGGDRLTRLISKVSVAHASPAAPAGSDRAASDGGRAERPQDLARAMRAAGGGRDVGKDFQEVASRLEKGESAASVETSLRKRVGEKMQPH